jgi:hypothetical protein
MWLTREYNMGNGGVPRWTSTGGSDTATRSCSSGTPACIDTTSNDFSGGRLNWQLCMIPGQKRVKSSLSQSKVDGLKQVNVWFSSTAARSKLRLSASSIHGTLKNGIRNLPIIGQRETYQVGPRSAPVQFKTNRAKSHSRSLAPANLNWITSVRFLVCVCVCVCVCDSLYEIPSMCAYVRAFVGDDVPMLQLV